MTTPDPALQKALDDLTTQVNPDNILAAYKVFHDHASELLNYLTYLSDQTQIGPCGGDPISREATGPGSFGGKVAELLKVHWLHQEELDIAANHLHAIARSYGHTDQEIQDSLKISAPGQP